MEHDFDFGIKINLNELDKMYDDFDETDLHDDVLDNI